MAPAFRLGDYVRIRTKDPDYNGKLAIVRDVDHNGKGWVYEVALTETVNVRKNVSEYDLVRTH